MIVVFFGQRNSGKTKLCKHFFLWIKENLPVTCHYMDSDRLRSVFNINGYEIEDEILVSEIAITAAIYEQSLNNIVLVSSAFPLNSLRHRISENNKVLWIYLKHDKSKRIDHTKKDFEKFEIPEIEAINTTDKSEKECLQIIINKYRQFCSTIKSR